MGKYRDNIWFNGLSTREQQIVAFYDLVDPLPDSTEEGSMDVYLGSRFVSALPGKSDLKCCVLASWLN